MTMFKGFEDLKSRDVMSFNSDGTVTVVVGDRINRYQVQMNPNGSLTVQENEDKPADQLQERKPLPVAMRWANTDQGAAMFAQGGNGEDRTADKDA